MADQGRQNEASVEERARDAERAGNVHMANGFVLKARAAYRVADAIRRSVGADDQHTGRGLSGV